MKKLKQLYVEFKKFITRGNVVDMAVGVVIASSFTAIVNAFSTGIIMPLINLILGGKDASTLSWVIKPVYIIDATGAEILDTANSIILDFGTLINSIFDFLLIALFLFIVIKVFNGLKNISSDLGEKTKKQAKKLAKKFQKQGISKEEAEAEALKQVSAEVAVAAPAEPPKPTTEELLTEIRDLLAKQQKTEE